MFEQEKRMAGSNYIVAGTMNLVIHLVMAVIAAVAAAGAYILFFVILTVTSIPVFMLGTFCLAMGAFSLAFVTTAVIIFLLLFANPKRASEFGLLPATSRGACPS